MAKRILFRIIGVVVILGLAYVAASWYIGQRAEAIIHDRVATFNQRAAQRIQHYLPDANLQVALSISDYQRHVFTSDVRYTLTITHDGEVSEIGIAGQLAHGPFPLTEVKRGNLRPLLVASNLRLLQTPDTQALFAARADKSRPPVRGRSTLTFRGSARSEWHVQPLTSAQEEVVFSGGTATLTLDNAFQDATLTAGFDSLRVDDGYSLVQIQDVRIDGSATTAAGGKRRFKTVVAIGSMVGQAAADDAQDVEKSISQDTRIVVDATLADGLLDGILKYSVGNTYTLGVDQGSLSLAMHVNNLDVAAVRALQRYSQSENKSEDVLESAVSALLAAQPDVALDKFRWQAPEGVTSANFALQFVHPDTAGGSLLSLRLLQSVQSGQLAVSVYKPMIVALLERTLVQAGIEADVAARQARMRVQTISEGLAQSGLFVAKEDTISTDVSYQDDGFIVNGEPRSLAQMLAAILVLRGIGPGIVR